VYWPTRWVRHRVQKIIVFACNSFDLLFLAHKCHSFPLKTLLGLGKTCQTIAFLAWLKYSRDRGELEHDAPVKADQKGDDNYMSGDDESELDEDDGDGEAKKEAEVIEVDTPIRIPRKPKHAKTSTNGKSTKSTGTNSPHLVVGT